MSLVTERDQVDTSLLANGQQKSYLVLSAEERAKGFVVPVRSAYKHVGIAGPQHPTRDLTEEEKVLFNREEEGADEQFVKIEEYPDPLSKGGPGARRRLWTAKQLASVGKGCNQTTTMAPAIAETYARNPEFYSGTYCVGCHKHLPVGLDGEFVWLDGSRVGSRDIPPQPVPRGDDLIADLIIKRLNEMLREPEIRADLGRLFKLGRVAVSSKTLHHPTLQCNADDQTLGVLGLLNGICGLIGGTGQRAHWGFIAAEFDESGVELQRFIRTPEK